MNQTESEILLIETFKALYSEWGPKYLQLLVPPSWKDFVPMYLLDVPILLHVEGKVVIHVVDDSGATLVHWSVGVKF